MKQYKLFLLLGFIILITGCSLNINFDNKNNDDDTNIFMVPDVLGMNLTDAEEILRLNNFNIGDVLFTVSNKYEEGLVVKTELVNSNIDSVVNVYVAVAVNSTYEVEDYIGKNYLDIKTKLEEKGLIVEVKEKKYLNEFEDLTVVEQEPKVGSILKSGDMVTLYIPIVKTLFPDFIKEKWSLSEIEAFCNIHDIDLIIEYKEAKQEVNGTIVEQSIKAGEKIISDSILTITVIGN